jgi:tetratricopeptide (TPR) repeat protein
MRAGRRGCGVLAIVLLVSARAGADGGPEDKAAAAQLFGQGLALMKAGNFQAACSILEASQARDAAVGTLLYLGECHEQAGRPASAWASFREAARLAARLGDKREAVARRRAGEVEGKVPSLRLVVPPEARVAGLEVRRDGRLVEEILWGTPVAVDPGQHLVEATAPGFATSSGTFEVSPGAHEHVATVAPLSPLTSSALQVDVPLAARWAGLGVWLDGASISSEQWGRPLPVAPGAHEIRVSTPCGPRVSRIEIPPSGAAVSAVVTLAPIDDHCHQETSTQAPAQAPPAEGRSPAPVAALEQPAAVSPLRSVGLVGAGVGGAGVAAGVVLVASAAARAARSRAQDDPGLYEEARGQYMVGWLVAGAGGALLAGGVALALTSPAADPARGVSVRVAPGLSRGGLGVLLGGTW